MPKGLKRYYGAGDLHFITCSCYRRQPLLGSARRRDLFLKVFEQVRRRYQFVVVGYVVMPEHFHLLISEPQDRTPSVVMQALKLGFARRVVGEQRRRRHRDQSDLFDHAPQHIWQPRSYDFNVYTARKRREKLRYMHRNPVKRGLVESPELWRWSSYRAYAFGERGAVRVNEWQVLKLKVSSARSVRLIVPTVSPPRSRTPRDLGHPQFFYGRRQTIQLAYTPRTSGAPG